MSGKWERSSVDTKPLQDLIKQLSDLRDVVEAQRQQEVDKAISLGENIEILANCNEVSKEAAEKVRLAAEKLRKAKAGLRNG